MTTAETRSARCANEGCPRPAEPGERYCEPCLLERSLFRRDARWTEPGTRADPEREADRR